MADRPDLPSWDFDRPGLAALVATTVVLAALVILPYVQYVLLGIVLAYILVPAQRRLEQYVGSMIAAGVLVAVAILAILLPVAYVLALAFREALQVVEAIQEGDLDVAAIEARLEATGYPVDLAGMYGEYQEPITTGIQGLATGGLEIVGGLPGILIGLTVTLFVLFALLRDRERLISWIREVVPIEDEIQRELLAGYDQLMWASVVGNVAVAIIQAIALGIGLAILDVPAVVFLTVATFVLALLPLVGAFGVWVPLSVYLVAAGRPIAAAGLVAYGSIVSASDTYLRPALIGRTSAFNSAIIVVGIFGGIIVFGAVGLFVGPVVLGGAKITVDVYVREQWDRATEADTPAETSQSTQAAGESLNDETERHEPDSDDESPSDDTVDPALEEQDESDADETELGTDTATDPDSAP
ncbi:AI-2E family transporter [Natronobacterium texcoconense]|uniref:Predicted PurR-regulated permease PerM n=1 Tax=Natronobacterium texcoconense TaxID=1095778 RepID=A0A1H1G719_NATTX|nr:AI-2E family transporter [Natronobacterium texcoconense]SDR08839.1 Predicted PurR-regulated permease PerM [Natronobacterium texcoconense]